MKISLLFSLLFMFNYLSAQSFDREKIKVKYYRPALYDGTPARFAHVKITETSRNEDGTKLTDDFFANPAGEPRAKFFYSKFNWAIKTFDATAAQQAEGEEDTISMVTIDVDLAQYGAPNFAQVDLKDTYGEVKGKKWIANITCKVPMTYSVYDQNDTIILENISIDNTKSFEFPKDFYSLGDVPVYKSKKAIVYAYNAERQKHLLKMRNDAIGTNLWYIEAELKKALTSENDKFLMQLITLKVKGKDKKTYADILALEERMKNNCDKIKENYKAENKMNWHTKEIHNEFKLIGEEYAKILATDGESGKTRFSNMTFVGLSKNMLWCLFFTGEFDFVLEHATELRARDEKTTSDDSITSLMNDMKISWHRLESAVKNYKSVYLRNKSRMGWE
ncbi:MAG: hypothetical protein HUJ25_03940 [Crocinitomicaceae bacterium]|nr:hypothetical protein [Crocinitomicaceae bacterium]